MLCIAVQCLLPPYSSELPRAHFQLITSETWFFFAQSLRQTSFTDLDSDGSAAVHAEIGRRGKPSVFTLVARGQKDQRRYQQ